jgi:hypothetical protein
MDDFSAGAMNSIIKMEYETLLSSLYSIIEELRRKMEIICGAPEKTFYDGQDSFQDKTGMLSQAQLEAASYGSLPGGSGLVKGKGKGLMIKTESLSRDGHGRTGSGKLIGGGYGLKGIQTWTPTAGDAQVGGTHYNTGNFCFFLINKMILEVSAIRAGMTKVILGR